LHTRLDAAIRRGVPALDLAQYGSPAAPYTWSTDSCPYYYEQVRVVDGVTRTIACCRHKHTPASCLDPSLLTQDPHSLKCNGRLGKCQIPASEQLDIA